MDWSRLDTSRLDPEWVAVLLEHAGWRPGGGRPGEYIRWTLDLDLDPDLDDPGTDMRGIARILLPLDRRKADYTELLDDAVATLEALASWRTPEALQVLGRLSAPPGDELRFRKAIATTAGAVRWPVGEDLIVAARAALTAGAKARLSRRAYFGSKHGRFARRFLDDVLMGQTDVGSYVVTAFAPTEREFPEKESSVPRDNQLEVGFHTGRDITLSLVEALSAVRNAVTEYTRTNDLATFGEAVRYGVSRDLTEAVRALVGGGEGATVSVEWGPNVVQTLDSQLEAPTEVEIEFSGGDVAVLERAGTHLATMTPTEYVRATGWVTVVARPHRGERGLIRLKVLAGSEARSLQVPLTEEQFEVAADAIAHDKGLTVSGRQEREGNRHWLYDASGLSVSDLPEPSPRSRTEVRGQTALD